MKNNLLENLTEENKALKKQLVQLQQHQKNLNNQLKNIQNARAYKLWQKTNLIKKSSAKVVKKPKLILKSIKLLFSQGSGSLFNAIDRYDLLNSQLNSINDQYQVWYQKNWPTKKSLAREQKIQKSFKYRPKISIITPVYNPDEKWLRACVESVLKQSYDNWELCLADDNSTKPYIKKYLNKLTKTDQRIKVVFRKKNGHISRASNSALKLATGEFIALLDHDDELAPNALFEVVKLLNTNKNADLIYSDEDKLELDGRHVDPFFKPDWSPDMFLSTNYLCHLTVIRKDIVDNVGGFRVGFEGSQDYDLFLRVTEKTNQIFHIPKILYSWRKIPNSTAHKTSAKNYAYIAAKKALKDHVNKTCNNCEIKNGIFTGSYRVKKLYKKQPLVSILIPTLDKVEYLKSCVNSILNKTNYKNFEVLILDTGSKKIETKNYYSELKKNKLITIYNYPKKNFNFAEANNWIAKKAKGSYFLFLNNDTEVINSDWLNNMMQHAIENQVGVVGAKLLFPNNTIQHMGVVIGLRGGASHVGVCFPEWELMGPPFLHAKDVIRNVSATTGACLLIKSEIFKKVNGFDKKFRIAFNDIDLCLKVSKLGYKIIYTPYAKLIHHESISFGRPYQSKKRSNEIFEKERDYFNQKWNLYGYKDPFYNENLTLTDESLRLKL